MTHIKVVYIEWVDSCTEMGWDLVKDHDLGTTISVGILVSETKDVLIVANSYDQDTDENNGRIYIPLCCIKKVRTLCQIQMKTKSK